MPVHAVLSYLAQAEHVFALDLALTYCRKNQQGMNPCSFLQAQFASRPRKMVVLEHKSFCSQKGESPFQVSLEMHRLNAPGSTCAARLDLFSSWIVLQALVNDCQLDLYILRFFLPGDRISIVLQVAALFFYLITLILVSVAETGLDGKSPRKQSGKH